MVGDEQCRWKAQKEDHEFGFGHFAFEEPMEHPNGGVRPIFMSGAEGRELSCRPRLGSFMLYEAGKKCRVTRTKPWRKPARD